MMRRLGWWDWTDVAIFAAFIFGGIAALIAIGALVWRMCCATTTDLMLSDWQCTEHRLVVIAGKYTVDECINWKRK